MASSTREFMNIKILLTECLKGTYESRRTARFGSKDGQFGMVKPFAAYPAYFTYEKKV
jgi:hypothetical protein